MKKFRLLMLALVFGLFMLGGCMDPLDEGFGQEDSPGVLKDHDDDDEKAPPPPPPGS